jgi:hypothetical protein
MSLGTDEVDPAGLRNDPDLHRIESIWQRRENPVDKAFWNSARISRGPDRCRVERTPLVGVPVCGLGSGQKRRYLRSDAGSDQLGRTPGKASELLSRHPPYDRMQNGGCLKPTYSARPLEIRHADPILARSRHASDGSRYRHGLSGCRLPFHQLWIELNHLYLERSAHRGGGCDQRPASGRDRLVAKVWGPPRECTGTLLVAAETRRRPLQSQRPSSKKSRRRPTLPGGLPPSTIGAGGLNCRVRNGNGCFPAAMATGNRALIRFHGGGCAVRNPRAFQSEHEQVPKPSAD